MCATPTGSSSGQYGLRATLRSALRSALRLKPAPHGFRRRASRRASRRVAPKAILTLGEDPVGVAHHFGAIFAVHIALKRRA